MRPDVCLYAGKDSLNKTVKGYLVGKSPNYYIVPESEIKRADETLNAPDTVKAIRVQEWSVVPIRDNMA